MITVEGATVTFTSSKGVHSEWVGFNVHDIEIMQAAHEELQEILRAKDAVIAELEIRLQSTLNDWKRSEKILTDKIRDQNESLTIVTSAVKRLGEKCRSKA